MTTKTCRRRTHQAIPKLLLRAFIHWKRTSRVSGACIPLTDLGMTLTLSDPVALLPHPLAIIFPSMLEEEFSGLKEDVRIHGLRSPIIMLDGKILDGFHRYRACIELGIEPVTEDLPAGTDPVAYVQSMNLHRRHLTASQRAIAVVACNAWAKRGNQPNSAPGAELVTTAEMAKAAQVSPRTIEQAKKALGDGLSDDVREGKLSVKKAAAMSKPSAPKLQATAAAASNAKAAKLTVPAVKVNLNPPRLADLIKQNNELSQALDAAEATIKTLRERCERLEGEVAFLKADCTVTTPLPEASVTTTLRAPGLESGVGRSEEILATEAGHGQVNVQVEEAMEGPATDDETPVNVAVMDSVALEKGAEVQAAGEETLHDTVQTEASLGHPSPLKVHTLGLLKVCPRSWKNPDQPDQRTQEYYLYSDAEDILEIEGRLQRGVKVSDDDTGAYYAYLEEHSLAAAVAMPHVVIQERTAVSAVTTLIPEASENSKIPAPGLEDVVRESKEILDPESCLCFTRALAEGLSPETVAAAIS